MPATKPSVEQISITMNDDGEAAAPTVERTASVEQVRPPPPARPPAPFPPACRPLTSPPLSLQDLRDELNDMKMSAMRHRAKASGVSVTQLDEASDSIDPKVALVDFIMAAESATATSGEVTSANRTPTKDYYRRECERLGKPLPGFLKENSDPSHQPPHEAVQALMGTLAKSGSMSRFASPVVPGPPHVEAMRLQKMLWDAEDREKGGDDPRSTGLAEYFRHFFSLLLSVAALLVIVFGVAEGHAVMDGSPVLLYLVRRRPPPPAHQHPFRTCPPCRHRPLLPLVQVPPPPNLAAPCTPAVVPPLTTPPPPTQIFIGCVVLLAYLEGLQVAILALEKSDCSEFRESHPRAFRLHGKNTRDATLSSAARFLPTHRSIAGLSGLTQKGRNVERFLVGRQFFVIFVVYLTAQVGAHQRCSFSAFLCVCWLRCFFCLSFADERCCDRRSPPSRSSLSSRTTCLIGFTSSSSTPACLVP